MLQPSSVDVRLDRFFRVFQNSRYTHIDPRQQQDELTTQVEPEGDDPFVLHPGEFVLGSTFEAVGLPDDLAGRLEGKALGDRHAWWRRSPVGGRWGRCGSAICVFGVDGRPTPVVAATEIMTGRPCYEVCFSDGQTIIADAAHLWRTTTKSARKHGGPSTDRHDHPRSPRRCGPGRSGTTTSSSAEAVQYPEQPLPIDPYVLGVWLVTERALAEVTWQATSRRSTRSACRYRCGRRSTLATASGCLPQDVRDARLYAPTVAVEPLRRWGCPHVPPLPAAAEHQRLALLQGLMDSDGYIDEFGRCEFVSIRECLSDAVVELAASLGLRPGEAQEDGDVPWRRARRRLPGEVHAAASPSSASHASWRGIKTGPPHRHRAIVDVRPVASYPVRCIQVGRPRRDVPRRAGPSSRRTTRVSAGSGS